jgi:hypothetical protein
MSDYALPELLRYLDTTNAALLERVDVARLNDCPADGGWSQAQVLAHLTRTETYFYPLFTVAPLLIRSQRVLDALNRLNIWLCKAAGMSFESRGDQPAGLTALSPQFKGRFFAPAFLKPRRRVYDWTELLASRERTRQRTLAALRRVDWTRLNALRFSHPVLGAFTLAEFVLFLGKHEEWHTEQIKRINVALAKL